MSYYFRTNQRRVEENIRKIKSKLSLLRQLRPLTGISGLRRPSLSGGNSASGLSMSMSMMSNMLSTGESPQEQAMHAARRHSLASMAIGLGAASHSAHAHSQTPTQALLSRLTGHARAESRDVGGMDGHGGRRRSSLGIVT